MKTPDLRPPDRFKQATARPIHSGEGARLFRSQQAQIQRRSDLSWRAVSLGAAILVVAAVGAFWLLGRTPGPSGGARPIAEPPVAAAPNPPPAGTGTVGAPLAAAPTAAPSPPSVTQPPAPTTAAKKTSPTGSKTIAGKASPSSAGHPAGGKVARRRARLTASSSGAAGAGHGNPAPRVKRPNAKPPALASAHPPSHAAKTAGASSAKPIKDKVKGRTVAAAGKAFAASARTGSKAAPKTPASKTFARPKAPPAVQLNDEPPPAASAARAPRTKRTPAAPGVELPDESLPADSEPRARSTRAFPSTDKPSAREGLASPGTDGQGAKAQGNATDNTVSDGDLRDAPPAPADAAPVAAQQGRRDSLE